MKKIWILCFALALSFAAIAGSIAYFTDEVSSNENVIASGSIDVLQHEQERVKTAEGTYTGTLRTFTQQQNLFPCVITTSAETDAVKVGNYEVQMYDESVQNFIDKIVTVENTGKSVAYVRTFVAVPALADGVNWLNLSCNDADDGAWTWDHKALKGVTINNQFYDIHVATYQTPLAAGETTPPSLLGFYMDKNVSNDKDQLVYIDDQGAYHYLGAHPSLTILVATQAAQSLPFANADEALNTTFGNVKKGSHPWSDVKTVSTQAQLDEMLSTAKYDDVIALMKGDYTLPQNLADGIRLVGWNENVRLSAAAALAANNVEFDNVTFVTDLSFTGHGSFQNVAFEGTLAATFTNISMFDHCTFAHTPASGVLNSSYLTVSDCTFLDAVAP